MFSAMECAMTLLPGRRPPTEKGLEDQHHQWRILCALHQQAWEQPWGPVKMAAWDLYFIALEGWCILYMDAPEQGREHDNRSRPCSTQS